MNELSFFVPVLSSRQGCGLLRDAVMSVFFYESRQSGSFTRAAAFSSHRAVVHFARGGRPAGTDSRKGRPFAGAAA